MTAFARPSDQELLRHATEFTFLPNDLLYRERHEAIRVEWRDDGQWAVTRYRSYVLNHDGNWEFEPQPSSRDTAFLSRCRFSRDDAVHRAKQLVGK